MNFHIFQWRSLKTRVILFTLAIFLVGIWALAFYASRMLREDMQRLLGEQQFSTASFIAAGVNEQLDDRLRALEKVAGMIDPAMLDNTAALQTSLEQRPVFQGMFNGGTFVTRLDGTATASIPLSAERIGVNYIDRDYISAALKEGKAIIGRPVMGKRILAPVLVMTSPIRDAQGKVIGALAGVTNLGTPNFLDKIANGGHGKTGTYLLAAPQHNLFVTSSDKSRIMRPLPAPGVNPLHDKFAHGYEGYGVLVNFRGEEELVAAKNIPVAGWFLGIALPTAEAFAPIRAMQQRMFWATILLTLLAAGLTSWMLRRQLSPMLAAVKTLAKLSATDRPLQPLPITRQDEIGQLIGGFNRLIDTLTQRKEALTASEARFRCLTDMSSDFYWETDVEHRFTQRTESNRGAADMNLRLAMFIGLRRWELASLSPDEAGWQAHRALLDAQLPFREFETSHTGGGGAVRHVSVSGDPVFDATGNFRGYRGIGSDVTERKVVEEKNQRLTQLYATLSQCNQAIVRSTGEEDLFPQICRSAVQLGGMRMAWIGLVDETSQRVKPVACYGEGAEYLEGIQISVDANDPFGRGPTGTAIREQQPFWCQDFQHDPATTPWHERGVCFGWGATASIPLQCNGVGIGILALCADNANAFDEAARNLLVEMAQDISYALGNFFLEAEHARMETQSDIERSVLELLVKDEPLPKMLTHLALSHETLYPGTQCSVLLLDADGRHLRHGAAPSLAATYCQAIDGIEIGPRAGSCGTAAHTRKTTIVADIARDPRWQDYKALALAHGLFACWSVPIFSTQGRVLGAIAIYHGAPRSPLPAELTAIERCANLASMAIERRQAEATLLETKNLLKTIIDTAPMRIFWKDKELRYQGCNPAFATDAGEVDTADVLGKDDYQLGWKEQAELYRADDRRVMDSGISKLSYDEQQTTPDGKTIWLRTSKLPLRNAANEMTGVLGIYEDITERKQDEIALLRSENNLSRAQAVAKIGSWHLDISTNRLELSEEAFRIFGIPRQEAVHLDTFFSAVHPDDREMVRQSWNEAIAGAAYDIEHRVVTDGETRWIRERAAIERGTDGRALFGVGTTQDITERKRVEDLLKAQQTQIKLAAQVFAQGREGIMICDARSNIIMANKAFAEISGYSEAELLGKNTRILSSGRHGPDFYHAMWEAINTNSYWAGEIWDRHKDGTEFPAWLTISAMHDEQGQVTHYLGSFSDLSDARAAESRIQHLSYFDGLTGLPNRALLQDRTAHTISMVQRSSEPMIIMLLAIDHFKRITDSVGHSIGDELLVEMAKRISDSVRAQDTVARLDGKEFVLLLPGTHANGAAHLAQELLWKLAQPCQLGDQNLIVTASIGIASYPENGSDFHTLLKAVDIAMRRAQVNGRNAFEFYTDDMYQQVWARDHMINALRNVLELDQLHLVYQPLVDLQTGQISGMEALLRWQHPELGAVSPAKFIPLAEEAGLIKRIGEWVLRRALRDIRGWLDKGVKVPHVAINVSPLQFHDNDLIAQVKGALAEWQIDPGLIYLEVTEGALMDDVPRSEAMLKKLKDLGVKLSLDDFGTGYSSLSYLKRFPFDKVKIDQSFVRDVTTSQSDAVLVKVIISMANGLGLKVIAEGVETEAQCEIMRTNGCDEIQGYFFSKPISAQAIEELFTEGRQLPPHLLRLRKPQRTLLLVDDEPNILASLKRLFRRDGHVIHTANSGPEGLDVLSKHKIDIIISDQRMPGMTGVEFLRAAKVNYPDTVRIVLSGYTELQSVTDAINEGAVYRFLTKPWEDEQLREHIDKAFEYKELLDENRRLDIQIRSTNQELVATNRQLGAVIQMKRDRIEHDETILAIVREALQYVDLPIIGLDDEGLMAFVNAAAEHLFASEGPLLGVELAHALPVLDKAIAGAVEGVSGELLIDRTNYLVKWNTMGASSRSQGKLVTLNKVESTS